MLAIAEFGVFGGLGNGAGPNWFLDSFSRPVRGDKECARIAYALTWANSVTPPNYYIPLPGQVAYTGFLQFYQSRVALFASGWNSGKFVESLPPTAATTAQPMGTNERETTRSQSSSPVVSPRQGEYTIPLLSTPPPLLFPPPPPPSPQPPMLFEPPPPRLLELSPSSTPVPEYQTVQYVAPVPVEEAVTKAFQVLELDPSKATRLIGDASAPSVDSAASKARLNRNDGWSLALLAMFDSTSDSTSAIIVACLLTSLAVVSLLLLLHIAGRGFWLPDRACEHGRFAWSRSPRYAAVPRRGSYVRAQRWHRRDNEPR